MKKKKYLLFGIGVGIIFQIMVFLIFLVLLGYKNNIMDSVPAVTFILALVILMLYPTIWGINYLNRLYDGRKHGSLRKRVSQRWAMNTGFVGGVLFTLLIMGLIIYEYLDGGLNSYMNLLCVGICFAILIYACTIYLKNYFYIKPKDKRINYLKKSNVINGDRRYTFLIDEVVNDNEYKGYVNGSMKVGDFVHLLEAGSEPVISRIKKIYAFDDKALSLKESNDEKVGILLEDGKENIQLSKYGVISSFEPCAINERIIHAENPRLVAMIKGYSEYAGDNDYTSALVYDACHSNYIVPALVPHSGDHRGEIMDIIENSQEISFLSVKANEIEDEVIMPIFTDWEALENYKEVIESEKAVSLLLSFPEVISIMRKYRYSGIALNPFGPKPFYLSQEYVNHITSLDGYKEDFIYNTEE